ncbi:hypothetical protein ACHAXR_000775, partial [Thalassiosira sp. AJA248-18]
QQPPPNEDCPICFVRLPLCGSEKQYNSCCGKMICYGCVYADAIARRSAGGICPFCRTPAPTSGEETVERMKERIEVGDTVAMYNLGCRYSSGGDEDGVPQDSNKALELWHQAAKLGSAMSHSKIANTYADKKDMEKAKYHWELGARGGDVASRYNLGLLGEGLAGNMNRAMKHFMISSGCGCDDSLKKIKTGFSDGHVTKDHFENALRAHKESKDEMQSDHRDFARRCLFEWTCNKSVDFEKALRALREARDEM